MVESALISVIIPTYNYAAFIGEAIQSVLDQTYRKFEIVVIDDGSTDDTKEVVLAFPEVLYLHQSNQGIAGARNAGWQSSRGEFLVFLDADDRLLPRALEVGVESLKACTGCAFVSGHWELIAFDGRGLPSPPVVCVSDNHYRALLDFNYIGTVGQVMFRRSIIEEVGGFNVTVPGCDDIELYMRIARQHPVYCHDQIVAQHRRHGSNTSGNRSLMLQSMLKVYQSQSEHVRGQPELEAFYNQGIEYCKHFIRKERKRKSQERFESNWLVKSLINLRHRIKAALIFHRYTVSRRRGKD